MNLSELLALLVVVVAVPLNWLVAALLWRLTRAEPRIRVLRANAIAALALAVVVTVFGAIFLNNGLTDPILNAGQTQIVTRGTLLLASVIAAAYWLTLVRRATSR